MSVGSCFLKAADAVGCLLAGPFFVGGWSVEGALKRGAGLKRQGYKVTYNLLGEHVVDIHKGFRAVDDTVKLINMMDSSNVGNVAVKPTFYGLELDKEVFYKMVEGIVSAAMQKGIEVEFDAESRSTIPDTFEVFGRFAGGFPQRNFVRQCVQAHLRDIFRLMNEYDLWDKKLRIVKGAGVYDEDEGAILKDPKKVMEQYWAIAERNYSQEGQAPYIATMRDKSVPEGASRLSPRSYIRPYRPVIEMLYGPLGAGLRKSLKESGCDVRVYIPFVSSPGDFSWFAYGLRRASTIRRVLLADMLEILQYVQAPGYGQW